MNRHRHSTLMALSAGFALIATACSGGSETQAASDDNLSAESNRGQAFITDSSAKPNILGIAIGSEAHTTLVAAVQAAELENVLVNAGPLTVFAPTNDAFAALPEGTVEDLLKPENKQTLANIVTSHAAPGKYPLEYLKDGDKLYQATGHYVDVEVRDGDTYVNGAKILATIEATNGIVHVVDKVFLIAAR